MPGSTSTSSSERKISSKALLIIVYLSLLAVSHLVRAVRPAEHPPQPGTRVATLAAVDGEDQLDRTVLLAYRDSGDPRDARTTPVLLLHGSPGSKTDFDTMLPGLEGRYRTIIPDLPGFGESTRDVTDYSIRAHAHYVLQLLDHLELDRVHVVGFSMGGGVALNLYDIAPHRVRSTTLLSAIGVQEFELFGAYRLNRTVHAVQLGLLWLAREAVPHMGLLDEAFFGVPYARNFYDSNQRPLRKILLRYEPPMLILHGERDFLVPPEAAREHHRLVPQSSLELIDQSHFMVFVAGAATSNSIESFLDTIEAGSAPFRSDAPPEREAAARVPFDPSSAPPFTGVALVLMMLLIAVATIASEDLTCIGVGLLAAQGRIELLSGVIACFAGIFIGDMLLYLAGRWVGGPALQQIPLRWLVRPELVETASRWFAKRGPMVILLSRFFPGTRTPTYFAVGMLRTRFWSFTLYFLFAVAVWTPLLVGGSMLVGERAMHLFDSFERFALPAMLLFGLWILVLIKLVLPLLTFRGRREWVGRWRRLIRWEFWPPWVFYPPLLLYVGWLMLRYRSPLLFTAANPAIPGGGFIAESKGAILDGLLKSAELVAWTQRIPAGDDSAARFAKCREFMERHRLDYPVVLKPDAGQRGSGVAVIRDDAQMERYFEEARFDVLIQEHVPGAEFGIFYYRYPDAEQGRIFSITEKLMPVLTGDGVHTVEQLILLDRRAVCMAVHYLKVQKAQLGRVPAKGESLTLVELGTHCRGAIFLDGSRIRTEPLERAIDEMSKSFRGFFFGRYDVKTSEIEELKRGVGFKVIELNGVTSEATHIYDPRLGLFAAYRTLFEQWRIAFEIGRCNRRRGARPSRLREMLRLMVQYRRLARFHPD
jgi:pimeloyl-ACP methyl ester carboxylesterase/membrane protein DedA with SNARE-associated domain